MSLRISVSQLPEASYEVDSFLTSLPEMSGVSRTADAWSSLFLDWCSNSGPSWLSKKKILARRQNDYLIVEIASPRFSALRDPQLFLALLEEFYESLLSLDQNQLQSALSFAPELSVIPARLWANLRGLPGDRFAWNSGLISEAKEDLADELRKLGEVLCGGKSQAWYCFSVRVDDKDSVSDEGIDPNPRNVVLSKVNVENTGLIRASQLPDAGAEFGILAHWGKWSTYADLYKRVVASWALTLLAETNSLGLPTPAGTAGYGFQAHPVFVADSVLLTIRGSADPDVCRAFDASSSERSLLTLKSLVLDVGVVESAKASLIGVFESAWSDPRGRNGMRMSTWMATSRELDFSTVKGVLTQIGGGDVYDACSLLSTDEAAYCVAF